MSLILKFFGFLLVVVLVLVVGVGLTVRYAPQALVSVANAVQSAARIDAEGLAVSYAPLALQAQQVDVAIEAQDIAVTDASAQLDFSAWWSDRPFWQVDVAAVAVAQRPGAAAPEQTDDPAPSGALDLAPFLSFNRVHIGELTVTGDAPLDAQLTAVREGDQINLNGAAQVAGNAMKLVGTLRNTQPELGFDLQVSATPDDPAGTAAKASLQGSYQADQQALVQISSGAIEATTDGQDHRVTELGGSIALLPGAAGTTITLDDVRGEYLGPQWQEPLDFSASGDIVQQADTVGVDLQARAGETSIAVQSTDDAPSDGWSGRISLESTGLHSSIAIDPYTAADLYPLKLQTNLSYAAGELTLTDLNFDSPANALAGSITLNTGTPLKLVAALTADRLYVPLVSESQEPTSEAEDETPAAEQAADVAAVEAASDDETETQSETVFSTAAIDWSWLAQAQIDASLQAKALRLQQAEFENLDLELHNKDGQLALKPFTASLGEGGFSGEIELGLLAAVTESAAAPATSADDPSAVSDTETQTPADEAAQAVRATAAFTVDGVALEAFGFVPQEELKGGALEVDIDLSTTGNSTSELAGALDGDILLMVQDATLMNDFVELAGSDLLMETINKLNPFAKSDPTTQLECALVKFSAADGQLKTDNELVMETSKMEIVGNGGIDLDEEKLNITFTPNAKGGVGVNVGSVVKFLKLGGTLAKPSPAADAAGLLKSGLAIGAAISTGGASVVAEGMAKRALGGGSACDTAKATAPASQAPTPEPAAG